MRWFLIILIFPLISYGQSPEIISIKEYNPQKKYNKPICIVDMYGEMECKNLKKDTKASAPIAPKFNPATDTGYLVEIKTVGLGSLKGLGTVLKYQNDQFSYGGGIHVHIFDSPDEEEDSSLDFMGYAQVAYHLFPRWYSFSKSKKLDLNTSLKVGYNIVGKEEGERKSTPFIGLGFQASYPISESFRILGGVDMYQNVSFKEIGNGWNIGLGFDF